jgi:DNA primase
MIGVNRISEKGSTGPNHRRSHWQRTTERIRQASDIVQIIGGHVKLRKTGARYTGLCPFHSEKTPSFTVCPQRQSFRCFGCQAHGDVFNFIARIEGTDFRNARRRLADLASIALQDDRFTRKDSRAWAAERRATDRDLPGETDWPNIGQHCTTKYMKTNE